MKKRFIYINCCLIAVFFSFCGQLYAGDRLLATGGISQIEGAGGGGLMPWAVITGYGTDEQTGGSVFYTRAKTSGGFTLDTAGMAVGFHNWFEVSLSQTRFGLGDTVPHEAVRLDTLGVKVKLLGDAVYDQDKWYPQVSIGAFIKHNEDFNFAPKSIGAKNATGVDLYIAATKLYLGAVYGRNLLLNASLQMTKANQFGILGFGGDGNDSYSLTHAFSAALMLTDNLIAGVEYRDKPDNIKVFKEDSAYDAFVTFFPFKNFSATVAYVNLGNIANKDDQKSWYFSGQISY